MFPPLCLGAVEEYLAIDEDVLLCKSGIRSRINGKLSASASRVVEQDMPVEVRFALYEWLRGLV